MKHMTTIIAAIFVLSSSVSFGVEEQTYDIKVGIEINCPMSDELQAFMDSIPCGPDGVCRDFDEWKNSFIDNMTMLIQLVNSEKIHNSCWSVGVEEAKP